MYSFRLAKVNYLTELRVILDQARFHGSGQRMRFHSGEITHQRPRRIDQQMVDCKLRQTFSTARSFAGKTRLRS